MRDMTRASFSSRCRADKRKHRDKRDFHSLPHLLMGFVYRPDILLRRFPQWLEPDRGLKGAPARSG
jgi:hypothetical protein